MADEIVVNYETENKQINLDGNNLGDSTINIKDDDDLLSGVELLTNKKKERDRGGSEGGYSSGEESTSKKVEEDYNFFGSEQQNSGIPDNSNIDEGNADVESKSIPINDPMMDSIKGNDNGGFKALHSMNSQEIKKPMKF